MKSSKSKALTKAQITADLLRMKDKPNVIGLLTTKNVEDQTVVGMKLYSLHYGIKVSRKSKKNTYTYVNDKGDEVVVVGIQENLMDKLKKINRKDATAKHRKNKKVEAAMSAAAAPKEASPPAAAAAAKKNEEEVGLALLLTEMYTGIKQDRADQNAVNAHQNTVNKELTALIATNKESSEAFQKEQQLTNAKQQDINTTVQKQLADQNNSIERLTQTVSKLEKNKARGPTNRRFSHSPLSARGNLVSDSPYESDNFKYSTPGEKKVAAVKNTGCFTTPNSNSSSSTPGSEEDFLTPQAEEEANENQSTTNLTNKNCNTLPIKSSGDGSPAKTSFFPRLFFTPAKK